MNQDAQIKKLYEETDLDMSLTDFVSMCNKVHETPFNFLCMDFAPKSEHMKFRSGFDEYIHIASEKEKEKENVSKE